MRLWTLHPKYLDAQGLVALWREALLAQKVLRGQTVGYRAHPQLIRFRESAAPIGNIARYLAAVHREALARDYRFDARKIGRRAGGARLEETDGQLAYEWEHLMRKLAKRDRARYQRLRSLRRPEAHPLFHIVTGPLQHWERP